MMYEFRDVNENLTQQYIPKEALQINGELIETQIEGYHTMYVQGRDCLLYTSYGVDDERKLRTKHVLIVSEV